MLLRSSCIAVMLSLAASANAQAVDTGGKLRLTLERTLEATAEETIAEMNAELVFA